jgi:hypothetical protein
MKRMFIHPAGWSENPHIGNPTWTTTQRSGRGATARSTAADTRVTIARAMVTPPVRALDGDRGAGYPPQVVSPTHDQCQHPRSAKAPGTHAHYRTERNSNSYSNIQVM